MTEDEIAFSMGTLIHRGSHDRPHFTSWHTVPPKNKGEKNE